MSCFVFILASLFFQAFNKIPVHRRMQLGHKTPIEIVNPDQENNVAEIIVSSGRKLELDKLRQRHDLDIVNFDTRLPRVGKCEWPRFASSGIKARHEDINPDFAATLDESAVTSFDFVVSLANELPAELLQSFAREQYVHVIGGSPRAMRVDSHRTHDRLGDRRLLQSLSQPFHRLVLRAFLFEEHADLLKTPRKTLGRIR